MRLKFYKLYFLIACILAGLYGCKTLFDEPEGIFITGDFTGKLTTWRIRKTDTVSITSYTNSSSIEYPSFNFIVYTTYAVLEVEDVQGAPVKKYFTIMPQLDINNTEELRIDNLRMTSGTRFSTQNMEIIDEDDSRTVFLQGFLKK